jgi:hypothetical protein
MSRRDILGFGGRQKRDAPPSGEEEIFLDDEPVDPRKKRTYASRKSRSPEEPEPDDDLDYGKDGMPRPENGATIAWLAQAFSMKPSTVKMRLADVKPLRVNERGAPIYAFADAAPKVCRVDLDDEEFEKRIKRMRPQDLPPMIHAVFWDGQNKKATWEKNAKNLWHTEDVVEVLGETFKAVRQAMQLWVDDLRQEKRLTDDQAVYLQEQVDGLQDDIYHRLVRMAKSRETLPLSETPIDEQRDV